MTEENKHELQVIISSGPKDLHRAIIGFAFAASAAISGVKVLTVLAGEGILWIKDNEPYTKKTVNGFVSIEEYVDILVDHKADICLCSACAEQGCVTKETIKPRILPRLCYSGLTEIAINTVQNKAKTIAF